MNSLIRLLVKEFREAFKAEPDTVASAPGRLDFLNTHQDYKRLPVVSVGVNLRTYIGLRRKDNRAYIISINMRDLGEPYIDSFQQPDPPILGRRWFGNYLRAAVKALHRLDIHVDGFEAVILSNVPVGSGLASSAALLVSFIAGLNDLFGLGMNRKQIAESAYIAEHDVLGIPCGRLDQYGSAFGGIIRIDTKPPFRVEELPWLDAVFIVMDSGIRHSTADIHPVRQREINEGLSALLSLDSLTESLRRKLGYRYDEVQWEEISLEEIMPFMNMIPEKPRKRILYTLLANKTTEIALRVLRGDYTCIDDLKRIVGKKWSSEIDRYLGKDDWREGIIGVIMSYQHELLRDLYDLSLPLLEKIWRAALDNQAYGSKLSGAGLGGSLIALARDEYAIRIIDASIKAGARSALKVSIDEGVRIESI